MQVALSLAACVRTVLSLCVGEFRPNLRSAGIAEQEAVRVGDGDGIQGHRTPPILPMVSANRENSFRHHPR